MGHLVKCLYCNKTFDRDKEPFIKVSARRYAHEKCIGEQTNEKEIAIREEQEKDAFYQLVKSIYGENYNFIMINQQATNYIKQYNFTWSGMTGCLHWFYNINHGSLEEGHGGIGIIPYIYNDVKKYYQNIYRVQEKNKKTNYSQKEIIFNITPPKNNQQQSIHLLDLGEDKDDKG